MGDVIGIVLEIAWVAASQFVVIALICAYAWADQTFRKSKDQ